MKRSVKKIAVFFFLFSGGEGGYILELVIMGEKKDSNRIL